MHCKLEQIPSSVRMQCELGVRWLRHGAEVISSTRAPVVLFGHIFSLQRLIFPYWVDVIFQIVKFLN